MKKNLPDFPDEKMIIGCSEAARVLGIARMSVFYQLKDGRFPTPSVSETGKKYWRWGDLKKARVGDRRKKKIPVS